MKIDLKTNSDTLIVIANKLEKFALLNTSDLKKLNNEQKVKATIMIDVSDIFLKKRQSVKRSQNLFDTKKIYSIKLKYFQADTLHACLVSELIIDNSNEYSTALLSKFNNILHQKLQD